MLRRFASYYRPHRKLFAVDMTSAVLRSAFMMVVPYLVVRMLGKEQLKRASLSEIWVTILILSGLMVNYRVYQHQVGPHSGYPH